MKFSPTNKNVMVLLIFYCKQKVLDDGIHTEPLDIVLNPSMKGGEKYQDGDDGGGKDSIDEIY